MPQLLVLVDATEADKPLLEISRQAMRSDFTLLLAWSPQVGRCRLASRHRPLVLRWWSRVLRRLRA